jgi:hypothetical protein
MYDATGFDPELGVLVLPRARAQSDTNAMMIDRMFFSKAHPDGKSYKRPRNYTDENTDFNVPRHVQKQAVVSRGAWQPGQAIPVHCPPEVAAHTRVREIAAYNHRLYQTHVNPVAPTHLFPSRKVAGYMENFSGGRRAIERYMLEQGYYRDVIPRGNTLLVGMRWYWQSP